MSDWRCPGGGGGSIPRQTSNAYQIELSGLSAIGFAIFGRMVGERNNCRPSPSTGPLTPILASLTQGKTASA
jgi:hypothetical protein